MDQQRKNMALIAITCLLLPVAGYRFWSMAMDARDRAALNSYHSHINQRIASHVGPHKPDPFRDLALTEEQRRKIDDILNASLPKLPPPNQGGPGKPHFFRVMMPMDKIRSVLTPEQRAKFDRMRPGNRKAVMGMSGGDAGPSGPPMIFMRRGPQDASQ